MKQASWIRTAIALGNEFHHNKKRPVTHNTLNIGVVAALLLAVAGTIRAATMVAPVVYIPIAGFVLGVICFSLIILVVHEASHGMFVISRERQRAQFWNRVFGWSVSVPFAINYAEHWEKGHYTHHMRPVEPDDPQTFNLLTGRPLVWMLVKMIVIPGYVFLWNPSRQYKTGRWLGPVSLGFWIGAGVAGSMSVSWVVAPALLFGLQTLGALNQLKGSMEHGGEIGREDNRNLRSRTSLFPLRWLVMPFNITLHFEHHLNYCVPWYDLVRYHRAVLAVMPAEVAAEIVGHDIRDQLLGRIGRLSDTARALSVD